MIPDKRLLRVYFDHPQRRTKRTRIGFTAKGLDFIDGELNGAWVSPITGVLQSIPNSEEPDFQTSNSGRYRKVQLADGTTINANSGGDFEMMAVDHADQAMRFTGENTSGIGFVTTATQAADTGYTLVPYAFGSGTDQEGVLIETFWADDQNLTGGGVGVKVMLDGRVEIYKDDVYEPIFRGSFSGGGYEPGTVRGASYERATDTYIVIRIEATRGRYITITSSKGGVCQYAAPWVLDGDPVLPAKKWGWYQPTGGGTVIAAPVVYGFPDPYAISREYQLSEAPGLGETYTARTTIDYTQGTVTLVASDGVTAYDPTQRICRFRVDLEQTAFIDGIEGGFPPLYEDTYTYEDAPNGVDVSEHVVSWSVQLNDGAEGCTADLELFGDAPIPLLTEREGRPIKLLLVPNPNDPDPQAEVTILDGVGGVPEWIDGRAPELSRVKIRVQDRLCLLREAVVTESVVFDGLALCRPVEDGVSVVALCFRQIGFLDSEMDLPDLNFIVGSTPPQRAGEWSFSGEPGDLWIDLLERAFGMAPQIVWGLRPTITGTRVYAIDPDDADPAIVTLYRRPDDVPDTIDGELGAWPALYDAHARTRLPREANLVRVTGYDPAADKGLQAYIADEDSRDPSAVPTEGALGFTRTFIYADPALTTQDQVDDLTVNIWNSVARKKYIEPFTAFLQFNDDGSPVWRGQNVMLKEATPEGEDAKSRIAAFTLTPLDESGEGLTDELGPLAAIPIRIASYVGGTITGLGGASAREIMRNNRAQIENGGIRRRGWGRIPSTSMAYVKELPPPP